MPFKLIRCSNNHLNTNAENFSKLRKILASRCRDLSLPLAYRRLRNA